MQFLGISELLLLQAKRVTSSQRSLLTSITTEKMTLMGCSQSELKKKEVLIVILLLIKSEVISSVYYR
jgi:hypothetical protein